jgi:hypothetical protein
LEESIVDLDTFWSPHRGAVSLTFDDGTESQLAKAIPMMDERRLKGTFYLVPTGDDWLERLTPWKEVAAAGHEIGNHSLSHTCSGNYGFTEDGLEDMSLEDIERDILIAQERLEQLAPHQQQWTFCYPCYCSYVGRGLDRQSYVPVVARHFLAGRVGGEHGFANHPGRVDLSAAWGLPTERMSGFEMIGLVEELTAQGRWVVFVFHEINGSRLTVGSFDFDLLINYLHRRREEIWTAPVVQVAERIAAAQGQAQL